MQRPVRRGIGEVEEKRPVIPIVGFHDELNGVVGERVRGVVIPLRLDRLIAKRQPTTPLRPKEIRCPGNDPVVAVEPALKRPLLFAVIADVPLAGHQRVVAPWLEDLRDRDAFTVEKTAKTRDAAIVRLGLGRCVGHVPDPGLMRMQPGEQRRPRWAAAAGVVKLGEPEAIGGELVEVRSFDLPAVAADI